MADLGDMIARLLLDSSQWNSGMKDVETSATNTATKTEGAFSSMGEGIGKIGQALAGLGLAAGLLKFGEAAVEASQELETFRKSMENLKGPGQDVENFVRNIEALEGKSPFDFPELAESAKKMVLLGASMEQAEETMTAIVETGTALGLTAGQITGVADAMSKLNQGAEPMRVMKALVGDSIPAWQMLATELGTNVKDAQEKVKTGMVDSKEVFQLLTHAMQGNKEKAAEWGQTWEGSMRNLKDTASDAMRDVGDSIRTQLNEIGAPILRSVAELVQKLADWWKGLPTPVKDAALAFGAAITAISGVGGALALLATAFTAIGAPMAGTVIAIAAVVGALAGLAVWVSEHWDPIVASLSKAWDQIEQIWGVTWGEIKAAIGIIWDGITAAGQAVFDAYAAIYSAIWDGVKTAWSAIWGGIKFTLGVIWGEIKAALSIFDAIATYLLEFWTPIKQKFEEVWNVISTNLGSVWGKLAATFGVVKTAATEVATELGKTIEKHEEAKPKVKEHTDTLTDLGTKTKEVTDKFVAMKDKTALLWAESAILDSTHKQLLQTVAKLHVEEMVLASKHQTLIDKFMAFEPPLADSKKGVEDLNKELEKLKNLLPQVGSSVDQAEASLKQLGITSTRAAEKTADQTAAALAQITAAGNMMSKYDQLMAKQADLKAQIELLIRTDGDHKDKLEQLQQELKDTTTEVTNMTTSTTDAYHQMGLKTVGDLQAIMDKDEARWKAAVKLSTDQDNGNPALVRQAKEAQAEMLTNMENSGIALTAEQNKQLTQLETDLGTHHVTQRQLWKTFGENVKGDVGAAFDSLVTKIITGEGSFLEIFKGLWQSLAKDAADLFLAPLKTAIEDFISTTLANLLGGQGLGGISAALTEVGSKVAKVFGSGSNVAMAGMSGATMGGESIARAAAGPGGAAASGGGAAASAAGSLAGTVTAVSGVVSAVSGVISNFQNAKMETTMNAVEHNTRYSMMYLGERADGGILGVLFKINEELAWGFNTKATENMRDLFKDWKGPALDAMQGIQRTVDGFAPYIGDTKAVLEEIRDLTRDFADMTKRGLDTLNVSVTATGVTTVEAARRLGDQIAANLSRQLVQTS